MKNSVFFFLTIITLGCFNLHAQSENYAKFYNKGNKLSGNNFELAEKNFRIAINDSLSDLKASFNLSNKYYTEGLYDEAISRQIEATKLAKDNSQKHRTFHNLGNALMKKELCSEAVLAYKNALRNDPSDDETRYNLALAKKCEEEQQNDDQNKDDQNKDNENKDDQNNDNKDNEGKDDQNKDDQNKDSEDNDNQNKNDQNKDDQNKDSEDNDNQNKNDQNKDDNKSEKPKENKNQQSKLSPQQIKNLLKAMENAEKKVQAKVNDKKQKGTKVVSEKDW